MNWTELKKEIYYCDGSLRDIYVLQTNLEDNEKWTDLINQLRGYLKGEHDLCSSAHVYIDKIQINNHFFIDNEIENDISPKEINSIEDHEKILKYMKEISVLLDKPVILTPENEQEKILIRVTNDQIDYLPNN